MSQKKTILFHDSLASGPYSQEDFTRPETRLGGTEMTIVRVAEKLAEEHDVWVVQVHRRDPSATSKVHYVGPAALDEIAPDVVIVVRNPLYLSEMRQRFTDVPLLLWAHDWILPRGLLMRLKLMYLLYRVSKLLAQTKTEVIAVSQSHRDHLQSLSRWCLPAKRYGRSLKFGFVYNPVCIDQAREDANSQKDRVDIDKLIYFSAPAKGLDLVLKVFEHVSPHFPAMKLHVAMPPYSAMSEEMERAVRAPNIVNLGRLDHAAVIRHVRTSLCTFYPADVWPESFGLVFAESNAVGTPVLAHPFGSAPEMLTEEQLCDAHDLDEIVKRLRRWRQPGLRPRPALRQEFTIDSVTQRWNEILFGSAQAISSTSRLCGNR